MLPFNKEGVGNSIELGFITLFAVDYIYFIYGSGIYWFCIDGKDINYFIFKSMYLSK